MPEPADPAMPLMPFTNYQQEECLARGEADSSSLALPLSFKLQKKRRRDVRRWGSSVCPVTIQVRPWTDS